MAQNPIPKEPNEVLTLLSTGIGLTVLGAATITIASTWDLSIIWYVIGALVSILGLAISVVVGVHLAGVTLVVVGYLIVVAPFWIARWIWRTLRWIWRAVRGTDEPPTKAPTPRVEPRLPNTDDSLNGPDERR